MRRLNFNRLFFYFFVVLIACPQIGWAAEGDRFSITPRVWFTNVNPNIYDSGLSASGHSSESTAQVPLQANRQQRQPPLLPLQQHLRLPLLHSAKRCGTTRVTMHT